MPKGALQFSYTANDLLHLWRSCMTAGVQLAQMVFSWMLSQEDTICAHGRDHGDGVQVNQKAFKLGKVVDAL